MDIYVGNLPYTTGDEELRQLFAAYGAVGTARVIMDKFTGQSRGFGFVDMPDRDAALKDIEGLNGRDIGGRHLVIKGDTRDHAEVGERGRCQVGLVERLGTAR